jgi:hypothetical protein
LASNTVEANWVSGAHVTFLGLNLSPRSGERWPAVTVVASLTDISAEPPAPVTGEPVAFDLGGESCNAVTGSDGLAACVITPQLPGMVTLNATFDGSTDYTPAQGSVGFRSLGEVPMMRRNYLLRFQKPAG